MLASPPPLKLLGGGLAPPPLFLRLCKLNDMQLSSSATETPGGSSASQASMVFGQSNRNRINFIPSSEFSAYLKQIKCILSAVKKYRTFSLVTDTIFIFSL